MVTSLGLAFLAGILSVLSPCVLPLLLGAPASPRTAERKARDCNCVRIGAKLS